ncbi:MAG: hypothetical protein FWC54_06760 [Actinomycetia bacterium]|nr:hypothetical protein [Actinomycetes bacterium]
MKLTFFAIPDSLTTLAIIVALFVVFFGIMMLVLWGSINIIIDNYPDTPKGEGKKREDEVHLKRRRLLYTAIIADGLFLTIILFLIIYIANILISI